jgi:para-nitrobenzyl esterase
MRSGPLAETRSGPVEGRTRQGVLLFAGIPYAAPPTGARRFHPPEPAAPWREVRSARRFGPAAPQRPGTGLTAAPLAWDEDCLTLNVCTPAVDGRARPVLVWIHGGSFRTGKGGIPWYDGGSFARRGDIVTVSLNYRLGALGFGHVGDLGGDDFASSGVAGLLDQIAALAWVRDNIAAFGGDPQRVTVAGESAGAMSVGALLGCPAAKGLFQRAILQSGAAHHVIPDASARAIGRELAETLGATSIEALQRAEPDAILDAQDRVQTASLERDRGDPNGFGGMPFQPCIDGLTLPRSPLETIRDGSARDVEVLCGTNLDETTLWGYGRFDEERLRRLAARYFGETAGHALDVYRKRRPQASPAEIVIAITTDHLFRIPAIRLCEAHGGTAYHYLFRWASRAFEGRLGATHALEIPFTFNNLDKPGTAAILGPGPSPQPLADAMHAAWIAFVQRGDPSCEALPEPWPRYDAERRPVMEFGEAIRLRHDPAGTERVLWNGLR